MCRSVFQLLLLLVPLCVHGEREQSIMLQDNRAPFLSSQHGNVFQSVSSRCAKQVEALRFRNFFM